MKRCGRSSWRRRQAKLLVLSLTICSLVYLPGCNCKSFGGSRGHDGLGMDLADLPRLSNAKSRSISPENFTGEKGKAGMATEGTGKNAARDLGQGWKVSPSVRIKAKSTFTLAEINGSGAIQQIWMTPAPLDKTRSIILRFYWDGETEPSVEVPLGDFFACGWGKYCQINSLAVCVNPGSAFNCYWKMPFRKKAKITMENLDDKDMTLYYQINYTLTDVPEDAGLLPRPVPPRESPLKTKGLLHDPRRRPGPGPVRRHLPGLGSPQSGLVGRGRDQVLHGRRQGVPHDLRHRHRRLLLRLVQLREPRDASGTRRSARPTPAWPRCCRRTRSTRPASGSACTAGTSPTRSASRRTCKVTIQALGWQAGGRYLPLEDDIASVAYWYQTEPHAKFPKLPDAEALKVGPLQVQK